jgi:hypothetical protein
MAKAIHRDAKAGRLERDDQDQARGQHMNRTDFLTYNGRAQTVSGWANELNISVKRFRERMRKGGIEAAMQPRKRGRKQTALVLTHNGETKSVLDWAYELGISASALRIRLAKHPVDVALAPRIPRPRAPDRVCEYDRYRNKAHWYGEPERLHNGKYYSTGHLEKYIRSAWAA